MDVLSSNCAFTDSKVRGANMGPIWSRQDPGGPHVGPMNFAIWVTISMVGDYCQVCSQGCYQFDMFLVLFKLTDESI